MFTLNHCKTGIAIAAMFAASGAFAAAGNKPDYDAAKDRISAEYKADKVVCDGYSGNKKDICSEQAKGKEKVARAEAEYNYTGKPADMNKVAVAKADTDYAVAKEMCDEKGGNEKDVCRTEAKATHDKAMADAKMTKKVGDARNSAAEDRRDADYKVAAEKCDALAGDAKAACISAAKTRFNKS
ncbi:MAG: hypothetical protein H7Y61_11785 [Rhizobiales bacterium]|nr:hypothetical protein [Rhizobacter sp.]